VSATTSATTTEGVNAHLGNPNQPPIPKKECILSALFSSRGRASKRTGAERKDEGEEVGNIARERIRVRGLCVVSWGKHKNHKTKYESQRGRGKKRGRRRRTWRERRRRRRRRVDGMKRQQQRTTRPIRGKEGRTKKTAAITTPTIHQKPAAAAAKRVVRKMGRFVGWSWRVKSKREGKAGKLNDDACGGGKYTHRFR